MIQLAAIRPDAWNLPLFLHVLGALALIGTLTLTAVFLFTALRQESDGSLRLALRSMTLGVIPAWVVLRGSAEWIADKEGYADLDKPPDWIDIGYMAGDAGLLLIVISSLLGWSALRKERSGGAPRVSVRVAATLISLLLVLNLVALWAMSTKPS